MQWHISKIMIEGLAIEFDDIPIAAFVISMTNLAFIACH